MRWVVVLAALGFVGCGPRVTNPDQVEISGQVTQGGKPVTGVMLHLWVTERGLPASIPVTDGQFQAKVTPGKYTYSVTKSSSGEFEGEIPAQYAEGSMDRQVDIAQGTKLEIKLD